MDPVEAGYIGPGGDNALYTLAAFLRVVLRENVLSNRVRTLFTVYIFLFIIHLCCSIQILAHYLILTFTFEEGITTVPYFMKCIYLTYIVIFAISDILIYHMYDILETHAFKQYEKIFPSYKHGLGDAPRLQFFSWSKFCKKVWQQRKNIKNSLMDNKMSVFKFVCALVFLCDLNHAINEMYVTYRQLPAGLRVFVPLSCIKFYWRIGRLEIVNLFNLFFVDNITNIIIFPNYSTPGPPTIFSAYIWIFRIVCLWCFCTKVQEIQRQQPEYFRPDRSRILRILDGNLEGNDAHWRVESAHMFSRWCDGQVEGRDAMAAHVQDMQGHVRQLLRDDNVDQVLNLMGEGREF